MAQHGLKRGENGLEIYVMCEIPNNVIQIDAFAAAVRRLFDRLQRPDAADAGRRPRFRDRRLRFRRARSRHARNAAARRDRRQAQPSSCRDLRRGARQLSRDRAVPRRARHRLDQRQCREPAAARWRWSTRPEPGSFGRRRVAPRAMPYHALEELPPAVQRLPVTRRRYFAPPSMQHGILMPIGSFRRRRKRRYRVAWAAVKKRYRKSGELWMEK